MMRVMSRCLQTIDRGVGVQLAISVVIDERALTPEQVELFSLLNKVVEQFTLIVHVLSWVIVSMKNERARSILRIYVEGQSATVNTTIDLVETS